MSSAQGKALEIFVSKTEEQAQAYQTTNPGAMCFSSDAESVVFDGKTHNFVTPAERAFLSSQLTEANQATVNSKLSISITTKVGGATIPSSQVFELGTAGPTYSVAVTYGGSAITPFSISCSGAAAGLQATGQPGVYTETQVQKPIGRLSLSVTATYKTTDYGGMLASKTASSVSITYVAAVYIIETATKITSSMTSAEANALIASANVIAKHVITSMSSIGKINVSAKTAGRYIYVLYPTSSSQGPQLGDVTVSDNSIVKERVAISQAISANGAQASYTAARLTELCATAGEVITGATFK